MASSIPVAYVDEMLDLRRGWVGVGLLDRDKLAVTRYDENGRPLGQVVLGLDEAAKVAAVWQTMLSRLMTPERIVMDRDTYSAKASAALSLEERLNGGDQRNGST